MDSESTSTVILEGAIGTYRRVNLEDCGADTSCLISFHSDLGSLGFELIGDVICSALASAMMRCYIQTQEGTRALLLTGIREGKLNVLGLFFKAWFADGASLTTATSRAITNKPELGICGRFHAWKGVHDLHAKHRSHMNELRMKHGEVQPVGDTLMSFASEFDVASVRISG